MSVFARVATVKVARRALLRSAQAAKVVEWLPKCSNLDQVTTLSLPDLATIAMERVNKSMRKTSASSAMVSVSLKRRRSSMLRSIKVHQMDKPTTSTVRLTSSQVLNQVTLSSSCKRFHTRSSSVRVPTFLWRKKSLSTKP